MAKQAVITSWNVRGLGDRVKRLAVLHAIKHLGSSVVCLQETHMLPGEDSPFSANLFGAQFHSAFSSYARGVSVLIHKNVSWVCTTSLVDPNCRYIFLVCSLDRLRCIIGNVYVPPPFSVEVLKILATFLSQHPGIPAIIVGDFNYYLDADLDKLSIKASGRGPRGGGGKHHSLSFLWNLG